MLRAAPGQGAGGAAGSFSTLTVTGQGLFADGSATAPSISFINAPTNGIYNAGSSNIGIAINGSASFLLGPSGNLQVGGGINVTFSPDAVGLLGVRNSIAVRGGAGFGMKAIAGSYSVGQDDFTICCSTATQGLTVLLPLTPAMNQYLNIKKVSGDANRLTIDGNGNLIDALSTQSTILQTRPNFALQFGSTVASPTGSAWQLL